MATEVLTRLVMDSSKFDASMRKSKKQVSSFQDSIGKGNTAVLNLAKGGLGKLVPAIGLAGGALGIMNKALRSTEQGADAMDRAMAVAKGTIDQFFQSVATGNLAGFIKDLGNITKTAKEAFDALDNLGTVKIWTNARIAVIDSKIAQLKLLQEKTGISQAKAIKSLQSQKDSLVNRQIDGIKEAMYRQFSAITGANLSTADMDKYLKMWENGTLGASLEAYKKQYTKTKEIDYTDPVTGKQGKKMVTEWTNSAAEARYKQLQKLLTAPEEQLKVFYDLLTELAKLLESNSNKARETLRAARIKGSTVTPTTTEKPFDRTPIEKLGAVDALGAVNDYNTTAALEQGLAIRKEIAEVTEQSIEIENQLAESVMKVADAYEQQKAVASTALDAVYEMGNAFAALGDLTGEKGFNVMGIIAQAIATLMLSFTEAQEKAAKLGPVAWATFGAAGLAQVLATVSAIKSATQYATGGIVGGTSYSGDNVLARVNSGEMILNPSQQSRLFALANGGGIGANNVHFVISGNNLAGVLDNHSDRTRRVR